MSTEKITYLLGAGASAQVLPLIKGDTTGRSGLPSELDKFIDKNREQIKIQNGWSDKTFSELEKIVQKCRTFGTPDLAAKYYLETNKLGHYHLVKSLISNYFYSVESSPEGNDKGFEGKNIDPRVVPFLTTIANKNKFPKDLKILSWNYDSQIEMGARIYFDSNFNVWPFRITNEDIKGKDYFLLHLNGVSGYRYCDQKLSSKISDPMDFTNPASPLISFAWEDDSSFNTKLFTDSRLKLSKEMIENTTILVVIGYSFPFFNRKVDNELFAYMKKTLRKIYFQDPHLDGDFLYNQFGLTRRGEGDGYGYVYPEVDISPISKVDQYYVPFEL